MIHTVARWLGLERLGKSFALQLAALLLGMGLLPLLVYYIASSRTTEQTILNMASVQQRAMLSTQQDHLRLQIEQIEALAANLGQMEEIAKSLQTVSGGKTVSNYEHLATQARIGYLLSNYRNMKGLVSIDLFSMGGQHYHVGDTLTAMNERSGLRDQLLAATARSSASVVWHGVLDNVQRYSHTQKVIAATKMVMRSNSSWLMAEPVGMLLINYSTDFLHAHLSQVQLGEGGQLLVLDNQKRLIYHPDKAHVGEPVAPDFAKLLTGASGSFLQNLGQNRVLLSYETIPGVDWTIVSLVPTSTLMTAMGEIRQVGVLLLLASALMVGFFVHLLVKRVVKPISDISTGFQRFQAGQLAQGWRMTPVSSMAPIRELVSWFNAFLEGIDKRREADTRQRIAATAFESQEGMFVTDAAHRILQVNSAFSATTGYSAAEVVGQTPRCLASGRHDAGFYQAMHQALADTGSWSGEVWNRRKDGAVFPEWLTITAVKDDSGAVTHFVATLTDITQRKATEEEIRHLAFYDPLTKLPNRRLLIDRLGQAILACGRSQQYGALMFLDLDKFKTLNDTLGHAMGDLLLQQVAVRLTRAVRDRDTVARLGGDEFVVLLENLSNDRALAASEAEIVGHKILHALSEVYHLVDKEHRTSSSMGITLFIQPTDLLEDLMKQADMAMYQAKEAGRNTLRFFDPHMQADVMARASAETELRSAIDQQQFVLHYQPQVDEALRVTGAEVLLRWQHPTRGLVPPNEFIGLAEDAGLIVPLGLWVLETTCRQLAVWSHQPQLCHLGLAVNVSARQFGQAEFAHSVVDVLQRSGARASQLKLELTESLLVNDMEDVIRKIRLLKAEGISFSLDDFGTGYSSLSYLKQLPLDQLKIDQSFVRDLLSDPNDASICRTVIALGRSMDLQVIAEGVELDAQHRLLKAEGCHAFQGYLFGRPMPLEAFEASVLANGLGSPTLTEPPESS